MSQNYIKKIVITGPESTGKTELTQYLSSYYNTTYVPEYARDYITKLNRQYNYNDIEIIARNQIELEKIKLREVNKVLFYDTWLIITKVWFNWVYNDCPLWLLNEIERLNIDLFLVCDIDIPWIPDSVRENGGENRIRLFNIYIQELEKYDFNYKIITGIEKERFNNALNFVDQIVAK